MAIIRITKEFRFEMAHALLDYNGPCKNIHGHSYVLFVTLIGKTKVSPKDPDDGMVMDFGILKKIVYDAIIHQFDHSLVLNADSPEPMLKGINSFQNVLLVPYQPTCENLLQDFANRLKMHLPVEVSLHSLKLYETASSYAEWLESDN